MSASSPCEQKHNRACPFAAVDSYSHFSFHYAIQFHPVVRISTRPMRHRKRLAKVEAIPFPKSQKNIFSELLNLIPPPHKMMLSLVQK